MTIMTETSVRESLEGGTPSLRSKRMDSLWRFFENLDEIVYVSDMDTYELVYMNAYLRKAVHARGDEEYGGEKCYEILQGRDSPCEFCTNHRLKPDEIFTWVQVNPIFHKRMVVKDAMLVRDGHRYRVELAVDVDSEAVGNDVYYYSRAETILSECLKHVFSAENSESSLNRLLAFLGKTFQSDRAYIFEVNGSHVENTYEWCAEGVEPRKNTSGEGAIAGLVGWWMETSRDSRVLLMKSLEEIKASHPGAYAILKEQRIASLAAGSVTDGSRTMGLIGLDNPDKRMLPLIQSLLKTIGFFAGALFRQRDSMSILEKLSFHDMLTGTFNRNALLKDFQASREERRSVGIVFCDVTGLKKINDSLGHDEGDRMLAFCSAVIKDSLETNQIYRIGGDEFVAMFLNGSRKELNAREERLKKEIRASKYHIAVGSHWSDDPKIPLDELLSKADERMYEDKKAYYECRYLLDGAGQKQETDS